MYKKFYGLTRNPFELSPDPYFLFATARHNEALASITHGVIRRKGCMVVTGEVGTGKTLLVRCLLEILRRQEIASANVFNPTLTPLDFLRYITGDLGLQPAGDKGTLLLDLNNYLIARYRKSQTTVLIVDEAQHLAPELLEEIRLLTNLETSQQKLLQIVLVGQPELDQKLDSPQLRQIKQRIALRCQLEPLQENETKGYILRRMQRAGANSHSTTIFPDETISSVHHFSRGIPRLINTICENALIASFAQKLRSVDVDTVQEIARDLRLNVLTPPLEPAITPGQQAIAKSLLQLVEALERVARGTEPMPKSSTERMKLI
jgi:type II secretory pathway predicted ATPase ExeA